MTREGFIEKIIYKNEENGYTVFSVEGEDGEEIFVGNLFGAGEGLYIVAEGDYVNHPQYNIQFQFTSCEIQLPTDSAGIERYLASGIVKGVGEVLAKKIVKKFKTDALRIMEEEPERLAEISGISEKKARSIANSYLEKKEFRDVVIFLSEYGISVNMAMKIYNTYGSRVYDIVQKNPYKLAEDVHGIGFKVADEIARRMGITADSEFRQRAAIVYILSTANMEGHMYLPMSELIEKTVRLIKNPGADSFDMDYMGYGEYADANSASSEFERLSEELENRLKELTMEGKLIIKTLENVQIVYIATNYYVELNSARLLVDLQLKYETDEKQMEADIRKIQKKEDILLDDTQIGAVKTAISAGVCVITGGPGTGKTTIIDTIIKYFSGHGMRILLAAPTGRAAKRMTEQTGWPAQTIHRLLEFSGSPEDNDDAAGPHFGRNTQMPLDCDALIVDEMSMVDSYLFYSLLQAVAYGTRLILVGDVNQLPSVGAGNVLKDIIASGCFSVVTLSRIYRQEEGSDIVYNAHKINRGEHLEITNKSRDFFFIPRPNAKATLNEVKVLISENLPGFLNVTPLDIQVLAPMRRNETGVLNLNEQLQKLLNPPDKGKDEHKRGDIIFRTGDKVMQIKNNYRQEWKIYGASNNGRPGYVLDEGIGVFNGDVGTITDISSFDEELTVTFDDGRVSAYRFNALDELEHAFAMTIHKSQGSEYPAVILPIVTGPKKLMNRNLLYTAITRAKRMVVLVGNIGMVDQMIDNVDEQVRYTTFAKRLEELNEISNETA